MNEKGYTIPNFTPKEITDYFKDLQIIIPPSNIQKPTAQIVQQTFESILIIFANTNVTDHLTDTENYESLYLKYLFTLTKQFLSDINTRFTFKDFAFPESKRFITILSNIMNFGMYRETKRDSYEKMIKMCQEKEEIKETIEDKIADGLKSLENMESKISFEEAQCIEIEKEIKKLEEQARSEYKNFRMLSNDVQSLKEKVGIEGDKESSHQLINIQDKQEIVKLKSQIINDPQRFFELHNELKQMFSNEKNQITQFESRMDNIKKNINFIDEWKEDLKTWIRKKKSIQEFESKIYEVNKNIKNTEYEILNDEKIIHELDKKISVENRKLENIHTKINHIDNEKMKSNDEFNKRMIDAKNRYLEIKAYKESQKEKINETSEKTKFYEQKIVDEIKEKNEALRQLKNEIEEISEVVNSFFDGLNLTYK